jgi:hypothetical protein
MPLLLLRRLAIIATPILFLALAPPLSLSARADDAPKAAHESAVLDRIFANWKARHDRVHSLHVTLDLRVVLKKGTPDFSDGVRKLRVHDEEVRQTGMQLWIEGDDHVCLATTPFFKVPPAPPIDTRRVTTRTVIVGQICSTELLAPFYATDPADHSPFVRHAFVSRNALGDPRMPDPQLRPLFLVFRPQYPTLAWRKDQCRLVDGKELLDGNRELEVQRTVKSGQGFTVGGEESCWVSPARDDVVARSSLRWKARGNQVTSEATLRYKRDPTYGWIPTEWMVEAKENGSDDAFGEYNVTGYAINEKIDPAVFAQTFPAGTPVQEQMDPAHPGKIQRYVIQRDGTKRAVSQADYDRLMSGPTTK